MSKVSEISSGESKLMVSFAIGRNKTVFVRGEYDATKTTPVERLEFLDVIQQFGQQLGFELVENFKASLMKVVLCEVDPGNIVFELETDQPAEIRRKAILTVQAAFDDEDEEEDPVFAPSNASPPPPETVHGIVRVEFPPNTWPMNGPSDSQ